MDTSKFVERDLRGEMEGQSGVDRFWYLVQTKPKQEKVASRNLEQQEYVTFLPLKRVTRRRCGVTRETIDALFPRYLFISLSPEIDDWSPIRSTFGVLGLVRFGSYYARLPTSLVEYLRDKQTDGGPREMNPPNLSVGDKVRIVHGVAQGYEGIIIARTARDRVRLLLNTAAGYSANVDVVEHTLELAS